MQTSLLTQAWKQRPLYPDRGQRPDVTKDTVVTDFQELTVNFTSGVPTLRSPLRTEPRLAWMNQLGEVMVGDFQGQVRKPLPLLL